MSLYRLGSQGAEVMEIQQALQTRGLYRGPVDGRFGGGTLSAVMMFQRHSALVVDGRVGAETWQALFGAGSPMAEPLGAQQALARRCLALTGAFETGTGAPDCFCGLSGDFDGQGISFGVLQWNFGQRSLQPLLKEMIEQHAAVARAIFAAHFDTLCAALNASDAELMDFARSVQHPVKHTVYEPWRGYAMALGRTEEFQQIQVEHAQHLFAQALTLCQQYGLWSERAAALMFDILVQNGGIGPVTQARIAADLSLLDQSAHRDELERRKLEIVANRRAEAAKPRWIDDVRRRKLCIARGEGAVHGIDYDLDQQFGIRLVDRAG